MTHGSRPRRTGRRPGGSRAPEAILEAARRQFAEHGYDKATIRAIAADAWVDPALVHHYYGTKERLFTAAMRLPVVPSEMIASAIGTPGVAGIGEHMVRTAVGVWDSEEVQASFLGLLRSALTNDKAATMLREFIAATIIQAIAGAAGSPGRAGGGHDARYRASLAASQMVGLAVARYVLKLDEVATASADELAAAIGPTLQRYLAGDVGR